MIIELAASTKSIYIDWIVYNVWMEKIAIDLLEVLTELTGDYNFLWIYNYEVEW